MLEGLDKIDWPSLSHAYGSAEDIPRLLWERASKDPLVAKNAEAELFGNIWRQGTVYQATAPAVPFLVELLMCRETHGRLGLVLLLASIAEGHSFLEIHQTLPTYAKDIDKPETKVRLAKELDWKACAREAVESRAGQYWTLLNDPDVRVAIPYLLSKLAGEAGRICVVAPGVIGSRDDALFDASFLMTWVSCSRAGAQVIPFVSFLQGGRTPLIQLGGALGVLQLSEDEADIDEALRLYLDALREPTSYHPEDEQWLWGEGDMYGMLLEWLLRFNSSANQALIGWLPSALPGLDNYTAADLAAATLRLAFDTNHLPKSQLEFTDLQLSLLQGLTRYTNILYSDPLIESIQQSLGLPNDIKRLKAFLEGA